jgi:tetratricopeptide (TPR) repeat protein
MVSLLGWCLRHIVLIVIAGFVLVGLLYRDEVFCIGSEQDSTGSVHTEQAEPSGLAPVTGPVDVAGTTDTGEISSALKAEDLPVEKEPLQEEQIDAEGIEQREPAGKSLIEEEAGSYSFRSESGQAAGESSQAKLKQKARAAYWRGDEEASVKYYKQLIEAASTDPDAHGELGNVLLKQGNRASALDEYRSAISLLIEQDKEQALGFLNTVAEEFPGKVQDLREQLETSGSDSD